VQLLHLSLQSILALLKFSFSSSWQTTICLLGKTIQIYRVDTGFDLSSSERNNGCAPLLYRPFVFTDFSLSDNC
jgi:hypothetical protein